MVVYIDLIILINYIFDFSLLTTVDLLLKRGKKMHNFLIGALGGELSLISLFVKMNSIENFVFKILLNFIMSVMCFGYKDKRYTFYNMIYLYLTGIVLGGFLTYLYNEFKIDLEYSFKYLCIIILGPLGLIIYYRLLKRFKNNYNIRYRIEVCYNGVCFLGCGFLDSGNKLVSPISGKPIILIEKEYITLHKLKIIPVPYNALNHHGIIECFKPDKVLINDREYKNVLIGLSEVKFNIDGCNTLLNARLENL